MNKDGILKTKPSNLALYNLVNIIKFTIVFEYSSFIKFLTTLSLVLAEKLNPVKRIKLFFFSIFKTSFVSS